VADPATPAATLTDLPLPDPPGWRQRPWARSRRIRVAALALAGTLAAGLLGWLLAGVLGAAGGQPAPGLSSSASKARAATHMVEVNGAALAGQPVDAVRQQLIEGL
jgi:hypothetical protein